MDCAPETWTQNIYMSRCPHPEFSLGSPWPACTSLAKGAPHLCLHSTSFPGLLVSCLSCFSCLCPRASRLGHLETPISDFPSAPDSPTKSVGRTTPPHLDAPHLEFMNLFLLALPLRLSRLGTGSLVKTSGHQLSISSSVCASKSE